MLCSSASLLISPGRIESPYRPRLTVSSSIINPISLLWTKSNMFSYKATRRVLQRWPAPVLFDDVGKRQCWAKWLVVTGRNWLVGRGVTDKTSVRPVTESPHDQSCDRSGGHDQSVSRRSPRLVAQLLVLGPDTTSRVRYAIAAERPSYWVWTDPAIDFVAATNLLL